MAADATRAGSEPLFLTIELRRTRGMLSALLTVEMPGHAYNKYVQLVSNMLDNKKSSSSDGYVPKSDDQYYNI